VGRSQQVRGGRPKKLPAPSSRDRLILRLAWRAGGDAVKRPWAWAADLPEETFQEWRRFDEAEPLDGTAAVLEMLALLIQAVYTCGGVRDVDADQFLPGWVRAKREG
jgi:hypothetical protein